MNFVVASAFRNSSLQHVQRWTRQCAVLHSHLRNHYYTSFRVIAAEGDSTDKGATRDYLVRECHHHNLPLTFALGCEHGRPMYGSVVHPDRMSSLSKVANAIFDTVSSHDDYLIYVESDLIWDAQTVHSLISLLDEHPEYSVISPLIFAGPAFYDIWAFRGLDGVQFTPLPPHHKDCNRRSFMAPPLVEVSSVGSCLVMRGAVARSVRIHDGNALVGWCHAAREAGHRIAVAVEHSIKHP